MNNKIKIFMCCHKSYNITPPLAVPIQGGRAINPPVDGIAGDNIGDNISDKNREYCELTVQYYAWKNEDYDAYGFCHYRRFFGFGVKTKYPYIAFGKMTVKQQERCLGTAECIEKAVADNDIIVTRPENLGSTVAEYYAASKHHYKGDLELFVDIISEKFPKLTPFTKQYLSQNYQYFCNMFIMKKQFFNEYCEMLFSILTEFDKRKTMHGDFQSDRTNGYLGERFLGIYISYVKSKGTKIMEVPRIDVGCTFKKRALHKLLPPESKRRMAVKKVLRHI